MAFGGTSSRTQKSSPGQSSTVRYGSGHNPQPVQIQLRLSTAGTVRGPWKLLPWKLFMNIAGGVSVRGSVRVLGCITEFNWFLMGRDEDGGRLAR